MQSIIRGDYELYRRWFERSLDLIWRLPADLRAKADPMAAIAQAEAISASRGVKSVAEGITDTISMTDRYSPEEIRVADTHFEQGGLPSLTFMRSLFSKKVDKIIKSGRIKSEAEYYTLKPLQDCNLTDEARSTVDRLLGEYELSLPAAKRLSSS